MSARHSITDQQFVHLAIRTCEWCQAVLHQGRRFFEAFEQLHGEDPWENDKYSCMLMADRLFLVTAIFHAVEYLESFNKELIERGDESFCAILDAVATQETRQKIRELRNMNEHARAYAMGEGRKQEKFTTNIEKMVAILRQMRFTLF